MIFSLLIIHNRERMSSITRVLHPRTWDYLAAHLPLRFISSPEGTKQVIMRDISDLVREFWRLSSDGVDGASLSAMYCLHDILKVCLEDMKWIVCDFHFCDCRLHS